MYLQVTRLINLQLLFSLVIYNKSKESSRMAQLFFQVAKQFNTEQQYKKIIKQVTKQYDLKVYRLHLFSQEHAIQVYHQLQEKYEKKVYQQLPTGWLYVWFIVCYIRYKQLDASKLVENEKHWKHISESMWNKDVSFLKYQLNIIIKKKGRNIWKPKQEELLKKIYPNHPKGEWNQIAKDFYFQSEGHYFKTPKQCRERWQNHLNNQINKGKWTAEQDLILFKQVKRNGTKWARIVPLLNNFRTEHMIKNRYKALLNKALKGKNLEQNQAVNEIIREIKEETNQNKSSKKEKRGNKKQSNKNITEIQQIQFVQSEELYQEPIQYKPETTITTSRRGRTRCVEKNQMQNLSKKQAENNRNQMRLQVRNTLQRSTEIQGCKIVGRSLSYLNSLIYPQESLCSQRSHSNQFLRSSNNGMFGSGHFPVNNSINLPYQDGSFIALDRLTIKQDKIDRLQKKSNENQSFKSYRSFRIRPNESFIYRLMN